MDKHDYFSWPVDTDLTSTGERIIYRRVPDGMTLEEMASAAMAACTLVYERLGHEYLGISWGYDRATCIIPSDTYSQFLADIRRIDERARNNENGRS